MNTGPAHDPAMALALFASTAAAAAISALRMNNLTGEETIDRLLKTLSISQQLAGKLSPVLEEHFENLADTLTVHRRAGWPKVPE